MPSPEARHHFSTALRSLPTLKRPAPVAALFFWSFSMKYLALLVPFALGFFLSAFANDLWRALVQ